LATGGARVIQERLPIFSATFWQSPSISSHFNFNQSCVSVSENSTRIFPSPLVPPNFQSSNGGFDLF
jgi:hypothetical protein